MGRKLLIGPFKFEEVDRGQMAPRGKGKKTVMIPSQSQTFSYLLHIVPGPQLEHHEAEDGPQQQDRHGPEAHQGEQTGNVSELGTCVSFQFLIE